MAALDLIEWDAPGPYRVVFSTRAGGVSEGAFASLNLGIRTEDDPACVVENRQLLCEAVGADPDGATMAWQRHGATITRAEPRGIVTPGTVYEHCDGLWTDEPGRAMLLLTADCLPVALVRTAGEPALAILHIGWRGLLAGIVGEGVARARSRPARGGHRPEHRAVLLRSRRRGRRAVPRGVRRRRRPPVASRPVDVRRAGVAGRRLCARRAPRRVHVVQRRAVLLAPPRRGPHRAAGSDRLRA